MVYSSEDNAIMRPSAWIPIAALWACVIPSSVQASEERINGIVRATVVTHCDANRRGGCAGSLTLERQADEKPALLVIRVPLGTPISRDSAHATLGNLEGQRVIVRGSRPGALQIGVEENAPNHIDQAPSAISSTPVQPGRLRDRAARQAPR